MASKFEAKFAAASLREAKQVFSTIAKSIDPGDRESLMGVFARAKSSIQDGFRQAAIAVRDKVRSNAQSKGAPRRLYSGARPAIFAFSDFEAGRDDKRKRSALVGVRTGLSHAAKQRNLYIQWHPASGRRKKDNTKLGAGGLSMSFGALFERGTADKRIRPMRYFRGAVFATRASVSRMLSQVYLKAAAHINRNK